MDASVIITTFQRSVFLKRAIDSVLSQITNYQFEIIVIDDNGLGTQNQILTQKSVSNYISCNKISYYPLKVNQGACSARNYGISKAKGDYIFFLDDDDSFKRNKVHDQITFMVKHNNFDGCLAPFTRVDYKGNEIKASSNFPVVGDFVNFSINGNFFTPMLCIKKNKLIKLGGFQKIDRFQDRFLMLNALMEKMNFACLKKPLHVMYEHNSNRITCLSLEKTIMSLDVIYKFISQNKVLFSVKEWHDFVVSDLNKRAVQYYISSEFKNRFKSVYTYFKICGYCFTPTNTKKLIKSIFNLLKFDFIRSK